MTVHSHFAWQVGEPITDDLVREVANCVLANYAHGRFTPGCFGIFSHVDSLVYHLARLLDQWDGKKDFKEHVQTLDDVPEWFVDLAVRVLPLTVLKRTNALTAFEGSVTLGTKTPSIQLNIHKQQ